MIRSLLLALGASVRTRQGFFRFSIASIGGFGSALIFFLWCQDDPGLMILFVPLLLLGAYLWASVMWRLMFSSYSTEEEAPRK